MYLKSFRLALLLFLFLLTTKVAFAEQGSSVCAINVLPGNLSEIVQTQFVGWRIKQTEDLESHLRQLWMKSKGNRCPGIASGHFLKMDKRTFAVLLVPEAPDQKGYKVVVFAEPDGKLQASQAIMVADVKDQSGEDIAIYRVPPGVYSSPENDNRIRSHLDGLQVERMEVTTTVYFWRNNHFDSLTLSD